MGDLLRIRGIEITKLFGIYNHKIIFSESERIAIIHGANGIGKTTILRIINNFSSGNYYSIFKTKFNKFKILLNDNSSLILSYSNEKKQTEVRSLFDNSIDELNRDLVVTHRKGNRVINKGEISRKILDDSILRRIEFQIPFLSRIEKNKWIDKRNDSFYTLDEVFSIFSNELPNSFKKSYHKEPDWLTELRKKLSCHLVESERLIYLNERNSRISYRDNNRITTTVKNYANDLYKRITDALAEYGELSQVLDQSFPHRLLSETMKAYKIDELKRKITKIQSQRTVYQRIGILDDDQSAPLDTSELPALNETQLKVLTLYVMDTEEKLNVLHDLSDRLDIFIKNINSKFTNKKIEIDKREGFVINLEDGSNLDLDNLSSGEQHELVLLYDLLFRVKKNTFVMIDEPELSLHIGWQKMFLKDLSDIVKISNIDVLLATHSPFIVGSRPELMVPLTQGE